VKELINGETTTTTTILVAIHSLSANTVLLTTNYYCKLHQVQVSVGVVFTA